MFIMFDLLIPFSIKRDRRARQHDTSGDETPTLEEPQDTSVPDDIYYKLKISCQFKRKINDLLDRVQGLETRKC